MNCIEAARHLPGYLDGAIHALPRARLRTHLGYCENCRRQLDAYRALSVRLANLPPPFAPADLAVRIRVAVSQARPVRAAMGRIWSRALLNFENLVGPLAVPATGGTLAAFAVFVLFIQSMLVGLPLSGTVPNDLPLNLVQPAQLESLAPFPVPGIAATDGLPNFGGLLLEATVNAQGRVVFYQILSGPADSVVRRQIDEVLLFSRFRPLVSFGRPADGGHVLLNFSEIRVRG